MEELEFIKKEKEALSFWQEHQIFEESIKQRRNAQPFVFYEGPPTANGLPGIHHVLARSFKDLICRYKTMQGFLVERKAGWDTHGLPVELEVEKELGFKNKTQIEEYGIKEFNKKAKASVWRYKEEWERLTERMGYWIDTKHPYITFETNYIETVWWLLKQIFQKGLLYQNYKVLPYCPRCSTPLSSHEVAQGYAVVQDPSIYIKFEILNPKSAILNKFQIPNSKFYLLVWTTTPWTLPANVGLAVDPKLDYSLWQIGEEILISYLKPPQVEAELKGKIKGQELIGLKYQPLYSYDFSSQEEKKRYEVIGADFISTEEGTGIVHLAPAFGEDDLEAGKKENLAFIKNIDEKGCFLEAPPEIPEIKGKFFKEADPLIFQNLITRKILLEGDLKGTTHEYPFCWRCHTPLIYFAFEAWYLKMTQVKEQLLSNNQQINWVPAHLKEGRFGQWLRDIKDWALSRNRYWGTPLPIWECSDCHHLEVIGSLQELQEKSLDQKLPLNDEGEIDLHRPYVDGIKIKCPNCGKEMSRREEVIDCWFDSGSMPYAQYHFPFEQTKDLSKAENSYPDLIKQIPFPADFICEAVDQTRGWFYTLLAISTLMDFGPAYKNVISLGLILDAKGEKMSKSKGNVVAPLDIIEKYGADTLRWYLFTLNSPGEEKRFSEADLVISQRRFLNTFWNIFLFYETYAFKDKQEPPQTFSLLNQWILADLEETKKEVISHLDNYEVFEAAKTLDNFVDDFSRWYLRRARRIFQKATSPEEWQASSWVLKTVLKQFSLLLAPFCPFLTETLWQELRDQTEPLSIHLANYPKVFQDFENDNLLKLMKEAREIAALSLSMRQKANLKVRQPLLKLTLKDAALQNYPELLQLIKEEVNVKEIIFNPQLEEKVVLDTTLTEELLQEGLIRDLIRLIQEQRKNQNLVPQDTIRVDLEVVTQKLASTFDQWKDLIQQETGAGGINIRLTTQEITEGVDINGEKIGLKIQKI